MEVFVYLLLGVLAYVIGSLIIIAVNVKRVVNFFADNPDNLPNKLPDNIQDFKEHIGEDRFDELYKQFQERNNE